jgi:hypothetical protein
MSSLYCDQWPEISYKSRLPSTGEVDVLVAGPPFLAADVLLEDVTHGRTGWQPVRQSGSDQRVGIEHAQLTTELAVVIHGVSLLVSGERPQGKAPEHSPRGLESSRYQRAGTLSGVVVAAARIMPRP